MERVRALIAAAVIGLAGTGCIHVHMDGEKGTVTGVTVGEPPRGAAQGKRVDGPVKQASAFLPAGPVMAPSLPKMLSGKSGAKANAMEMTAVWQNRVAYLPDPTKNGAMGAGLVGQLFLFAQNFQCVAPEGPLTIEMFDETPRAGRPPESVFLGRWRFEKEVLGQLRINDERLGACYALFLPWPDYRADVVRVRLTVKYEPDGGFPLWATPTTLTIDTTAPNASAPVISTTLAPPGAGGLGPQAQAQPPVTGPMSPFGGPPPRTATPGMNPPPGFPNTPIGMNPPPGSYPQPNPGVVQAGGMAPIPLGGGMPNGGMPNGGMPNGGMPMGSIPMGSPAFPQPGPQAMMPMAPQAPRPPAGGPIGPLPIPTPNNMPTAGMPNGGLPGPVPPAGMQPIVITAAQRRGQ